MFWGIKSRTSPAALQIKLALRIFEDSLCSCGHSSLLSHGREGVGEYEIQTVRCHACAEAEKAAERDSDKVPGMKTFVRDLHDDPRDPDSEVEDGD